jgi:hypothetical protein
MSSLLTLAGGRKASGATPEQLGANPYRRATTWDRWLNIGGPVLDHSKREDIRDSMVTWRGRPMSVTSSASPENQDLMLGDSSPTLN